MEAFNEAHQKWLPVDPLVTWTVGKPSRLEPPANDPNNVMSYVVAFEEDGVARDVTRRYAKAYNAKTRKLRVEAVEGGAKWWKKAMKIFKRREGLVGALPINLQQSPIADTIPTPGQRPGRGC